MNSQRNKRIQQSTTNNKMICRFMMVILMNLLGGNEGLKGGESKGEKKRDSSALCSKNVRLLFEIPPGITSQK